MKNSFIMNVYYILWSDAINKILKVEKSKDMWKFYSLFYISFAMGFNLFMLKFVLINLSIFNKFTSITTINIFGLHILDSILTYSIFHLFPFLILNYFLIFYKDKYKLIIIKYKHYKGKVFAIYFVSSLMAFPLFFIVGALKYYFLG